MAKPTINDVHIANPVLQNILVGYANAAEDFAAMEIFPAAPVDAWKGSYGVFDKKYWFLDGLEERAPGGAYARGGIGISSDSYETSQWGKSFPIADETAAANQTRFGLRRAGVRWLAQQSFIRKERHLAATCMVSGVWGTTNTTDTDWDDASGVPITNIRTAKRAVRAATGLSPNALLMGEIVYDALTLNAQVVGKLQYTTQMTASQVESLLAPVLGVGEIHVSRASYNTANEGQTESMSPIIDDDCLLVHNDMSAVEEFDTTAAKWLVWQPGGGAGIQNEYRDEDTDSDVIKHKEQWALKIVAAALGYLWTDIV